MMIRRTHDDPSPGMSCFTVIAEKSLQLSSYTYFFHFSPSCLLLLVLIDSLQVLSIMAPKPDRVYARGQSKSVAPYARLVIGSDDEREP